MSVGTERRRVREKVTKAHERIPARVREAGTRCYNKIVLGWMHMYQRKAGREGGGRDVV